MAWCAGGSRKKALDRDTIEIWFADEARIGQKNKITRRWAKRGTRPSAPRDQRTASTYIFGAVCPKEGKGAALIMPACNTEAMNLHLAEIAATVAPAAHAILLVDQAGWHLSTRLLVPANITIILLPPKCPELNPVENVWQFMRDNWLSNRIFKSYDDLVDHCCAAWNKLVDQPWRIMSIGLRQWAHGWVWRLSVFCRCRLPRGGKNRGSPAHTTKVDRVGPSPRYTTTLAAYVP